LLGATLNTFQLEENIMLLRCMLAAFAMLLTGMSELPAQGAPPAARQQMPACVAQFLPLRQEVEKRFPAVQAAIDRKAGAAELCKLLTHFTEAESKMVKYAEEQGVWCDIPPTAIQNMKASQARSQDYRKQACTAAAQAQRRPPPGPSLSDALSAPVPDASTTRTGRGTFDSLSGNPLAR
jgi:hypothetical protein